MSKGVNTATSNAQRVKVGDYGSLITIELNNIEGGQIHDIEWVRAINVQDTVKENYIDIPDFSITDGKVSINLPPIERGEYNLEIKDDEGRIYPAEGTLKLIMLASSKDAIEVYYTTYRELIVEDVTPVIESYLSENPDDFKGEQGDTGEQGDKGDSVPPKIYSREEFDSLTEYDDNTLYIIGSVDDGT